MVDVQFGEHCHFEEGVILGYDKLSKLREGYEPEPVMIGNNVRIRAGTVIYAGCIIGNIYY